MSTTTTSATSMNFIGFDEMQGTGTAPILYNRIVILPSRPQTAGRQIHPAAGYLPGQQPFLKLRKQVWNKKPSASNKRLAYQGFRRVSYV